MKRINLNLISTTETDYINDNYRGAYKIRFKSREVADEWRESYWLVCDIESYVVYFRHRINSLGSITTFAHSFNIEDCMKEVIDES